MEKIEVGDVVFLTDAGAVFTGCFGVVDEVHDWGVVVTVPIATSRGKLDAPLNSPHGRYIRIGRLPLAAGVTPAEVAALIPIPAGKFSGVDAGDLPAAAAPPPPADNSPASTPENPPATVRHTIKTENGIREETVEFPDGDGFTILEFEL